MKKILVTTAALILALLPQSIAYAAGGVLFISPEAGVYRVGETFEVSILADTDGRPVNAIEAELAYNPGDFAVERVSTTGSILTTWSTAPAYDGAAGLIKFSGWADKQYTGADGLLITVVFRPLRVAQSTVLFNSGAMLAADAKGSNIINAMRSASFATSPAQVSQPQILASSSESILETASPSPELLPSAENTETLLPAALGETQAASLLTTGIELAPIIILFFGLLILIAFCIAYVLHRSNVR